MKLLFFAIAMTVGIASCRADDDDDDSQDEGVACADYAAAGLVISVRPVVSPMPTVTATDGTYTEALEYHPVGDDENEPRMDFVGAWERQGTYIMTIEGEGYETVTTQPVTVESDECHVIPQHVEVTLTAEED